MGEGKERVFLPSPKLGRGAGGEGFSSARSQKPGFLVLADKCSIAFYWGLSTVLDKYNYDADYVFQVKFSTRMHEITKTLVRSL
jgi:hypothetical protein